MRDRPIRLGAALAGGIVAAGLAAAASDDWYRLRAPMPTLPRKKSTHKRKFKGSKAAKRRSRGKA